MAGSSTLVAYMFWRLWHLVPITDIDVPITDIYRLTLQAVYSGAPTSLKEHLEKARGYLATDCSRSKHTSTAHGPCHA